MRTVIAMSVAALSLFVSVQALGKCDGSDRIRIDKAGCVHTWHSNALLRAHLGAQSKCPDATVVVKWDLKAHKDYTWYLKDGKKRRAKVPAKVRRAYCCRDLGLCNRWQDWDQALCQRQYAKSEASKTCSGAEISYRGDQRRCKVRALCRSKDSSKPAEIATYESQPVYLHRLMNCGGWLATKAANCRVRPWYPNRR